MYSQVHARLKKKTASIFQTRTGKGTNSK